MRFAVASDDGKIIAAHTGRCRSFVVFDVVEDAVKRVEVRQNIHTAHALGLCADGAERSHDSHSHSHDGLLRALEDCQALISRGMGRRLVIDLLSRNIAPVFCKEDAVEEAASLYAKGKLLLSHTNSCSHL
ncbi:MAG: NifB/NifX family molybdenum-iron cluster-binding protein [Candidatus Omnitrophota bacterium]